MTFREFFRELWGHDPFPWQQEYAKRALAGDWPNVGVPTAAGKTALIDIAVFALAARARGAGRRIFFVVDRRVIVDEAAQRAQKIAEKLAHPNGPTVAAVAQALRELGGEVPLQTSVLRGGIPRDDVWAESPLQPAVICSTVDQVGSNLLFRAYGTSTSARPIRAGLAAFDSIILLDEAHTSRAFAETLRAIERYRSWAEERLELPLTVVEMSATPARTALCESPADTADETLRRRWEASKRARLITVDPVYGEESANGGFAALVQAVAREARALRDERGARVIGVITNRVRTAREAHRLLDGDEGSEAILLTGRSRPWDRDRVWQDYGDKIHLGRQAEPEKPIFVVATQCVEVGANLDFDGLVTELASIDALEQRFGRLDRDGRHAERTGATHAAIVAQKDQTSKKYEDALYGAAMPATWEWLGRHVTTATRVEELPAEGKKKPKTRKVKEQFVEMGVRVLRAALGATEDRMSLRTPSEPAPVLMPVHVDLLSQTYPEPAVTPEPAVYLHGPETGPADVQIVWRADLEERDSNVWADLVAMCPPAAAEMMPVPLYALKEWLTGESVSDFGDMERGFGQSRKGGAEMRPVLCWRGVDDSELVESEGQLRPGMTVVVPSSRGGCDRWGWNPASTEPVDDIGDAVKWEARRPTLRLAPALAQQWGYEPLAAALRTADEPSCAEAIEKAPLGPGAAGWVQDIVTALSKVKPHWIGYPEREEYAAALGRASFEQSDSRASYTGDEVGLAEHMTNCARMAAKFASVLPERLRKTVECAAEWHDAGKADPRFQAWLRGGNPVKPDDLIAKSKRSGQNRAAIERARVLAGYPKGGRHELTSGSLLAAWDKRPEDVDWDLLLHLVASHHGFCRPFAPVVEDLSPCTVTYGGVSVSSDHGLERVGSGVSERFWKLTAKYGWYGLAYLETLVRLSDHRQSEAEQTKRKGAHV
jgi:CRISPR-associated endonuclease/helicase Cas3